MCLSQNKLEHVFRFSSHANDHHRQILIYVGTGTGHCQLAEGASKDFQSLLLITTELPCMVPTGSGDLGRKNRP